MNDNAKSIMAFAVWVIIIIAIALYSSFLETSQKPLCVRDGQCEFFEDGSVKDDSGKIWIPAENDWRWYVGE